MKSKLAAIFGVALTACLSCAGFATAAPQGPWILPALDLSETGQSADGKPSIAFAPDGTATAVWVRSNGTNFIIQASTRPPGGSFGPPENLSATGRDATDPEISVLPDGAATVVWSRSDGSNTIIQSRTRPPGGSFEAAEDLSPIGEDSQFPRIAAGPEGTTVVAWSCILCGAIPTNLVQISTRPPGGSFGSPQSLSGGGGPAINAAVAVGPGGMVAVAWRKRLGPDWRIQAAVRPAGGSFGVPSTLSAAGVDFIRPEVATGPDRTTTVVWQGDEAAGPIQGSTRPPDGSFAPAETLSGATGGIYGSVVEAGDDGSMTVAWNSYEDPDYEAQTRTRVAGGVFGPIETLSAGDGWAEYVQLAAGPAGLTTAIWRQDDGATSRARAATRASAAEPFGAPQYLSDSGQAAWLPEIAVGPDGAATGVWRRSNGANSIVQTASTQPPEFALDVTREGTGSGAVTSTPAGIDCGADCTEDYTSYTKVTLTAAPDTGSSFGGWSGACEGAAGVTCELEITEAATAGASFTADPPTPPTPPAPDVCPANKLKPGKLKKNTKNGTAKLAVTAGGEGKVIVQGSKKAKKSSKKVGEGGKGKIKIKAKGKAAKTLRKKGRVKIKVKLVYKPGGGCPNKTVNRKVKLVRK